MLELMHMQALGLDFKCRNADFLVCSQLWFSSNNSASSFRRKTERRDVRLVLTCLSSPLPCLLSDPFWENQAENGRS